mgnify:CR=1 FL=1
MAQTASVYLVFMRDVATFEGGFVDAEAVQAALQARPLRFSHVLEVRFTARDPLVADQAAFPPYGSNLTFPVTAYTRCHQTSGTHGAPMRWLDTSSARANGTRAGGNWRRSKSSGIRG